MSLLNVLSKIESHIPEPFVAPVPEADQVKVLSIQKGIPYWFHLPNPQPGWWILEPGGKNVTVQREAHPYEYLEYLDHLRRFYVIALFPTGEHTWLVTPFNASDAAQRGWKNAEPRTLHLVRNHVEPLTIIAARDLAGTLLYDFTCMFEYDIHEILNRHIQKGTLPKLSPDFQRAYEIVSARIQERERVKRKLDLEDQARWHLEFTGAEMIGWDDIGDGQYRVRWAYGDEVYAMQVSRDMRIVSAGVCLAGTDSYHNLSSIVQVMEERKRQNEDW